MKIYAVFFTNHKYTSQVSRVMDSLQRIGFDSVIHYTRDWLEGTEFYGMNKKILDYDRGAGYWLWKPYIILETFSRIAEGDVVFYQDAGDSITKSHILNVIHQHMKGHDHIVHEWGFPTMYLHNRQATKRDCFILMDCDQPKYHDAKQVEAGTIVFKNTEFNRYFMNEWIRYCSIEQIVTDAENIHGENFPDFRFHRHDQSVLTNLLIRHDMERTDIIKPYIQYNIFNA